MKAASQLYHCEHCPSSFMTRKELVSHNLRVNHERPSLVCPWCSIKPRDFSWPQDLRRHIRNSHREQHDQMPPKLLSSSNCFYFCTLPKAYMQLHGASSANSEEATLARQLMTRWCHMHSRDLKKWQEGWALDTSSSDTSSSVPSSSDTSSVPPSSAQSSSIPSAPSCTAPSNQTSLPALLPFTSPATTVTESNHELKRKHQPTLSLKSITLASSEVKAHLQDEDTNNFYLVKLSPEVLQDHKTVSSLTRRMCSLSQPFTLPSSSWTIAPQSARLLEDISMQLGVHPKFVNSVLVQPGQQFKLVRSNCTVPQPNTATIPTSAASLPAQNTLTPEQITTPVTPAKSYCSEDEESLRTPSPFSLAGGDTPSYNPESPSYIGTRLEDMISVTSESPSYNPHSPAYTSSLSLTTQVATCTTTASTTSTLPPVLPTYTCVLSQHTQTATAKQVKPRSESSVTCTPAHTSSLTTLLPLTSAQTTSTHTLSHTTQSAFTKPAIPTYIPTPINTTDRIKGMAMNLLKLGSLPLLPPAPREWSAVTDETVSLTPTLLWPPKNWQTLSSDQRALASEFAVMSVHQQSAGKLEILDRSELRHLYNYLVLPGCKGCRLTPLAQTQSSNYKLVKAIALGNLSIPLAQQENILSAFKRPTPTPLQIQISHIPLRITNTTPPPSQK